jgi:hypothetical protein
MFGFGYTGIIASMKKLPSGGGNGALTTAWITATSETDTTIISALNTLETDLTTYGLTAKIKALYPMVGGTAAKHKFNFMDARDLDAAYRLTFNGGWTHASTGALPNGTNAYANTFMAGTVIDKNSTHNVYLRTNSTGIMSDIGILGTTGFQTLFMPRHSNILYSYYPYTADSAANTDSRGNYTMVNASGIGKKVYKNATSLISIAFRNEFFSGTNFIFSNWGYSAQDRFSNREIASALLGNAFTDAEIVNYNTAIQAFQTTLSRNV